MALLLATLLGSAGARAETGWPLHGANTANHRYSALDAVTPANVSALAPRWIYQSGERASFQATPVVVEGVMYLSLPFSGVAALDARSGAELWRYRHPRAEGPLCCGPANRGVSVAGDRVFVATVDARLVALDRHDGSVLWDRALAPRAVRTEQAQTLDQAALGGQAATGSTGVGANMAPLVHEGRVLVGITGVGYGLHLDRASEDAPFGAVVGVAGRYGRPGFLAAFDAATGERLWQFDTIPERGWEGEFRATTPDGVPLNRDLEAERAALARYPEAARHGGGSVTSALALDAGRDLVYFGVGNPSPQMDDRTRPGDNLYTASLVALRASTGELVWYYQQVPHDVWGYDVANPPVLLELAWQGEQVPVVAQAGKTGWVYVLDRRDGRLLYRSEPFVPQRALFTPATDAGVTVAPGALGGANWSPSALDPVRKLLYVPAMHVPMRYQRHQGRAADGAPLYYTTLEPADEPDWGTLSALDLADGGRLVWQQRTAQPLVGGVLATAGGLVFTGEADGHLSAFDALTGERLWRFQCGAGVNAPPVSYELDGVQYISVAAGGNSLFGYRPGGALITFALPARAEDGP